MLIENIAETVRRAADAVPPSRTDLSEVIRRHRSRRNRKLTAAAGALTVVVASALLVPGAAPGPPETPASQAQIEPQKQAPTQAGVQRLPVDASWAVGDDKSGSRITGTDPGGMLELDATGGIVATARPEVVDHIRKWVPLQDGRTVLLGGKDLRPGVQRQDGVDVSDFAIRLIVLAADGRVEVQREVRIQGQDVQLIGATGTTAYLYRGDRIVAHDLAGGTEQRLTTVDPVPLADGNALTIQGGLLFAAPQPGCALTVTDLATGRKAGPTPFADGLCPTLSSARLSPDGRTLAVPATVGDQGFVTVGVLRVDVATGQNTFTDVSGGPVASDLRPGSLGVGWTGPVLRVVWLRLPSPGVHPFAAAIRTATVN